MKTLFLYIQLACVFIFLFILWLFIFYEIRSIEMAEALTAEEIISNAESIKARVIQDSSFNNAIYRNMDLSRETSQDGNMDTIHSSANTRFIDISNARGKINDYCYLPDKEYTLSSDITKGKNYSWCSNDQVIKQFGEFTDNNSDGQWKRIVIPSGVDKIKYTIVGGGGGGGGGGARHFQRDQKNAAGGGGGGGSGGYYKDVEISIPQEATTIVYKIGKGGQIPQVGNRYTGRNFYQKIKNKTKDCKRDYENADNQFEFMDGDFLFNYFRNPNGGPNNYQTNPTWNGESTIIMFEGPNNYSFKIAEASGGKGGFIGGNVSMHSNNQIINKSYGKCGHRYSEVDGYGGAGGQEGAPNGVKGSSGNKGACNSGNCSNVDPNVPMLSNPTDEHPPDQVSLGGSGGKLNLNFRNNAGDGGDGGRGACGSCKTPIMSDGDRGQDGKNGMVSIEFKQTVVRE